MNNLTAAPQHPGHAVRSPFYFNSVAYLLEIDREKAANIGELLEALRNCSPDSIFQHTFRTLQQHHFISDGYSNDFAHWAHLARNEEDLAKKLAEVDIQSVTSIENLRGGDCPNRRRVPASRTGITEPSGAQTILFLFLENRSNADDLCSEQPKGVCGCTGESERAFHPLSLHRGSAATEVDDE
jgi:Family of unknown function (DUF5752)